MAWEPTDMTEMDAAEYQAAIDGNFACLSAAGTLPNLGLASNAGKVLQFSAGGSSLEAGFALRRQTSIDCAGSDDVTLTASQAGHAVLVLFGALTGDIDLKFPADDTGQWLIYNNTTGDYAVTLLPVGGSGFAMDRGERDMVMCWHDGSTMRELSRLQTIVGSVDIDLTLTGAQAVSGLAFRPGGGIFFGAVSAQAGHMSMAMWDGTNARAVADRNNVAAGQWSTGVGSTGIIYYAINDGIDLAYGTAAATADGFAISRSKSGTPSGTFVLNYLLWAI